MSNMSYCRFHNTRLALLDCVSEMEYADSIEDMELSSEEKYQMSNMYSLCEQFIGEFDRLISNEVIVDEN